MQVCTVKYFTDYFIININSSNAYIATFAIVYIPEMSIIHDTLPLVLI